MITAASSIARAVHAARVLCASSPTFIDALQLYAPGVTDAMDRVFLYQAETTELKTLMRDIRPMIVVGLSNETEWEAYMPGCSLIQLTNRGSVIAVIVQDVHFDIVKVQATEDGPITDGPDDQGDSYLDACNLAGGIVDDMSGVFGSGLDLKGFDGVSMIQSPMRPEIDERHNDDFWASIVQFNFGDPTQ